MTPTFARNQFSILFIALLAGLSACSQSTNSGQGQNTSTSPGASGEKGAPATSLKFVKASAAEGLVSMGGTGEAIVQVTVQSGYHVNANPPTYSYLRATELTLQPADGITIGFITYPTAVMKKFAFADKPLAVYEGDIPIKIMLKADSKTAKGPHALAAKLNVQACDDQVCYPPGSLDLSIPVTIR